MGVTPALCGCVTARRRSAASASRRCRTPGQPPGPGRRAGGHRTPGTNPRYTSRWWPRRSRRPPAGRPPRPSAPRRRVRLGHRVGRRSERSKLFERMAACVPDPGGRPARSTRPVGRRTASTACRPDPDRPGLDRRPRSDGVPQRPRPCRGRPRRPSRWRRPTGLVRAGPGWPSRPRGPAFPHAGEHGGPLVRPGQAEHRVTGRQQLPHDVPADVPRRRWRTHARRSPREVPRGALSVPPPPPPTPRRRPRPAAASGTPGRSPPATPPRPRPTRA